MLQTPIDVARRRAPQGLGRSSADIAVRERPTRRASAGAVTSARLRSTSAGAGPGTVQPGSEGGEDGLGVGGEGGGERARGQLRVAGGEAPQGGRQMAGTGLRVADEEGERGAVQGAVGGAGEQGERGVAQQARGRRRW